MDDLPAAGRERAVQTPTQPQNRPKPKTQNQPQTQPQINQPHINQPEPKPKPEPKQAEGEEYAEARLPTLPLGQGVGGVYHGAALGVASFPDMCFRDSFLLGHPGFAWAARRDVIGRSGFYDRSIIGGGQRTPAHTACGPARPRGPARPPCGPAHTACKPMHPGDRIMLNGFTGHGAGYFRKVTPVDHPPEPEPEPEL